MSNVGGSLARHKRKELGCTYTSFSFQILNPIVTFLQGGNGKLMVFPPHESKL